MTFEPILSIADKAVFVAKDIEACADVRQSLLYNNPEPYIELYIPSKRLLAILSEHEVDDVLRFLQGINVIRYEKKRRNIGSGPDAYGIFVKIESLNKLTKIPKKNEPARLTQSGVQLDLVRSILMINGVEVLLGKAEGDKTLQYWICFHTIKKPNKPIEELKILNSYRKNYGLEARNRAIRDAVIALNRKIKSKLVVDKELFIYSRGRVTYVEDTLIKAYLFPVKM